MLTQSALGVAFLAAGAWLSVAAAAQEIDFQVYSEPPRLLLDERRVRLLKRERERESLRWQQFDALMSGKARMTEPGFSSALWATVTGKPGPCREAADWGLKTADARADAELRQLALVFDWCQGQMGEATASLVARKLSATLGERPSSVTAVRSRAFAALAVADTESELSQKFLKYAVEEWWRPRVVPLLKAGRSPGAKKEDLYALVEFLHAIRDNLKVDLRDDAPKWFDELGPVQVLGYYPQPWPATENEYRIPAYSGNGDPDLHEAAFSRAAELALVAYDANPQSHQFLQGWLMQDRFLMRGEFGIGYEFLWANPYQPGLSFTYMPDVFHARGQLLVRGGWDEDSPWFSFAAGQAQAFVKGRRLAIRLDARQAPVELGPVRVFFSASGLKFESGWSPPAEEGSKAVDDVAFIVGLEPNARYDVEIDHEEMSEVQSDGGGIVELKFAPGRKGGVRLHKAAPTMR